MSAPNAFGAQARGLRSTLLRAGYADHAAELLESRLRAPGALDSSPGAARTLLALHLWDRKDAAFAVIYVDARLGLSACEEPSTDTRDAPAGYARAIAKRALDLDATVVFLAHNDPSAYPEPSKPARDLTRHLVCALRLIDVRVKDHFVVGSLTTTSFAERGLL